MKRFIVYSWSDSVIIAGEESLTEIDGAYVVINQGLEAKSEDDAIMITAGDRGMEPCDLIAVELK